MAGNSINYSIKVSAEASQAQKTIEQLSQSLNRLQTVSSQQFKINIDYREAAAQAEKLQAALQKAVNVNTGQLDFRQLTSGLQAANTNVQTLMSSFEKAGASGRQAMQQLQQAMTQAVVPAQKATGIMAQFGTTLMNTFKWQAASQMIHGMQSAISNAVSYIENLNKSLTDIRIVTGKSVSDMTQFTKQANQMARTLSTSTKSYADAALIYYQQGDNDTQAAQKAAITLKATNAAFKANAQEMSEMLTAVWNSYKAGGAQLEQYVDVMAKLGSTTATSMEEIATSLQKVAATANTVGVSMNQMSSIVATVSSVTREGAESIGTAYKTILARMGDLKMGKTLEDGIGLGTVSSSLKTIGVNLLDATGQMRDMGSVITDLGTKWQTMNTAQKTALAQVVAGKRQYTQLMALFENWDDYQKNMANAENSKGSLNKMQQTYESSVEAAKKRLQASKEDLFGTLINDQALITFNNTLSKTVDMVNNVVKGLGGLPGILAAVGSAMMTAFKPQMLDKLSSTFTNIGQAFAHPLRTLGIGRNTYGSYESLIKTGGSFNANTIARGDQLAGFKLRGGENALYNSLITSRMYNERQMAQMMQNQQYNQLQPEQQAMYQSLLAGRNATILKQQSMLQNGRISTSQMQALQQQINGYSDRSSQLYDLSDQMHNAYADQVQGTSAVTLRDYIANNNNAVLTNRDYARAATAGRNAGNLTGSQDLRTISQMYQAFTHGNTTDQNNALTNLANFIVNNQSKVQDYNNLASGLNSNTFQSITSGTQLRDLLSQEAEKAGTIKLDDILGDDWAKKCVTTQDAQALLSSFQNQIKQAAQQTSNQAAGATALGNMLFGPQGMQNLQNLGNQKGNLLSQLRAIMAGEDPSKQEPKTTFADSLAKGITNVGKAALKASQGMNQMQQMIAQLKEGDTAGKIASVTTAVGSLVTTFATQGLWAGAGQMIGMGVQFLISKVEESAQKTREAQLKQAQYANELQQKSEEQNKKIQDNYSKWQSLNQQYEAGEISFSSYQSAIQAVTDALGMQSDTVRNLIGDYAGLNAAMEEAFNSQLSEAATTASMALTARQSGWANQGVKWITDNQNTGLTIEQRKASEIITQAGNYFNRIDNNGQVTDRDRVLVQAGIDRNASVLRFKDLRDQFMDSAVSTVSQTFLKDFLGGTENGIYSGDLATIGDTWDTAVNDDIIFTSLDSINTAYERLQTLQQLGEAGFNEKYGAGSINADQTTSVLNWLKTKEGQNFFSFLADMSNGYSDVKSTAQLTAGRVAIQSQKNSWLSAENLAAHSDTDIYGWLLDQVLSTIYTDHANGEYTDKERAVGKQLVNELVQSTSASAQQQIRDSQTRATIQQSIADLNPDLNKKATDEIIQRTGLTNADLRYTDVNLLDVTNADTLYRSLLASTNARENRSNASIRVNANGDRLRQEASDDFKYSDWLSNTIGLLYEGDQLKSAQDILKYGSNADIAELYNKIIAEEFNEDKINQHIAQAMADNQQLLDMATGAALSHVTQSSLKSYLESNADEQGNIGAAAEHLQQVVGLYNQYWGAEGFDATQQIGDAATLLWKQLNDVFDPEQLTNVNIDELATMTWKDALESLSNVFDENIITNLSTPESVKQLALVLQILSQYTQLGVDISSSTLTDVEQAQLNRKKAIQNIKALSTINTDVASWSSEDIGRYEQLFNKQYAELLSMSAEQLNELVLVAMQNEYKTLQQNGGTANELAYAQKQIHDQQLTITEAQEARSAAILGEQQNQWSEISSAADSATAALKQFMDTANTQIQFSAIEQLKQSLQQAGIAAEEIDKVISKLTSPDTSEGERLDLLGQELGNAALAKLSVLQQQKQVYSLSEEQPLTFESWKDQLQDFHPEISASITVTDIVWGGQNILDRLQNIEGKIFFQKDDGTLARVENLFVKDDANHTIYYKMQLCDANGNPTPADYAFDVKNLFTKAIPNSETGQLEYQLMYKVTPESLDDKAVEQFRQQFLNLTSVLPKEDAEGALKWNNIFSVSGDVTSLTEDQEAALNKLKEQFKDIDAESLEWSLTAKVDTSGVDENSLGMAERVVGVINQLSSGSAEILQDLNGNTIGFTFSMSPAKDDKATKDIMSIWELGYGLDEMNKQKEVPISINLKTKVTNGEGGDSGVFDWIEKLYTAPKELTENMQNAETGTVWLNVKVNEGQDLLSDNLKEGTRKINFQPGDGSELITKTKLDAANKSVNLQAGGDTDIANQINFPDGMKSITVTVTPTNQTLYDQAMQGADGGTPIVVGSVSVEVEVVDAQAQALLDQANSEENPKINVDVNPNDPDNLLKTQSGPLATKTITIDLEQGNGADWLWNFLKTNLGVSPETDGMDTLDPGSLRHRSHTSGLHIIKSETAQFDSSDSGSYELGEEPLGAREQIIADMNSMMADIEARKSTLPEALRETYFSQLDNLLAAIDQRILDEGKHPHDQDFADSFNDVIETWNQIRSDISTAEKALAQPKRSERDYDNESLIRRETAALAVQGDYFNAHITTDWSKEKSDLWSKASTIALPDTIKKLMNVQANTRRDTLAWNDVFGLNNLTTVLSNLEEIYKAPFSDNTREQILNTSKLVDQLNSASTQQDWDNLVPALNELLNYATGLLTSDDTQMVAIGQFLVDGLVMGLSSADLGALDVSIANLGDVVWQAFCAALGIHSPSRLTMALGAYLIQGLEVGISQASGTFNPQFGGIAGKIYEALSQEIQAGLNGAVGQFNGYQLDLSHLGIEIDPAALMSEAGWKHLDEQYGSALEAKYGELLDAETIDRKAAQDEVDALIAESPTARQYREELINESFNKKQAARSDDLKRMAQREATQKTDDFVKANPASQQYYDELYQETFEKIYSQMQADVEELSKRRSGKAQTLFERMTDGIVEQQKRFILTGYQDYFDNDLQRAMFAKIRDQVLKSSFGYSTQQFASLTDEDEIQKILTQIDSEYSKQAQDVDNEIATTIANLQADWTSVLSELAEQDAAAAQQVYDTWVKTFEAIAAARAAILGESLISDAVTSLDQLAAIAGQLMTNGKSHDEVIDFMTTLQSPSAINDLWMNMLGKDAWKHTNDYKDFYDEAGNWRGESYEDYQTRRRQERRSFATEHTGDWLNGMYQEAIADAKNGNLATLEALKTVLGAKNLTASKFGFTDEKGVLLSDLSSLFESINTSAPGIASLIDAFSTMDELSLSDWTQGMYMAMGQEVNSRTQMKNTQLSMMEARLEKEKADLDTINEAQKKGTANLTADEKEAIQDIFRKWGMVDKNHNPLEVTDANLQAAGNKLAATLAAIAQAFKAILGMILHGKADGFRIDTATGQAYATKTTGISSAELQSLDLTSQAVNQNGLTYMALSNEQQQALRNAGYTVQRVDNNILSAGTQNQLLEQIMQQFQSKNPNSTNDAARKYAEEVIANGIYTAVKNQDVQMEFGNILENTVLDDYVNALRAQHESNTMNAAKRAGYDNIEEAMAEAKSRVQYYNPENAEELLKPENWDELEEQELWANTLADNKEQEEAIKNLTTARDSGALKTLEEGGTEQEIYGAYGSLADVANSYFNVSEMADSNWAKENIADLQAWAEGGADAAAAMERLELSMLHLASDKYGLKDVEDDLEHLNKMADDLNFGDEITQDMLDWINAFSEAHNLTADQLRDLGRIAGIELDIADTANSIADEATDVKQLVKAINSSLNTSQQKANAFCMAVKKGNLTTAEMNEAWGNLVQDADAAAIALDQMGDGGQALVNSIADAAVQAGDIAELPADFGSMDIEAQVHYLADTGALDNVEFNEDGTITYTADTSGAQIQITPEPLEGNVSNAGAGTFQYAGPEGMKTGSWSYNSDMTISGSYPVVENGGGGGTGPAQATNGRATRGGNKSPAQGGGGGGGGGGGKKQKKGKSKADIERYHEIDQEIKRYEAQLEHVSKKEDMAFGYTKVALMREELAKMNKEMESYQERLNEAAAYLSEDRANVEGLAQQLGFAIQFDERGTITNWEALQEKLIDWYNEHKDDEAESGMEGPDDVYKRMTKVIEDYEDSLEQLEEYQTKMLEQQHEMSEKVADIVEETHKWKIELSDIELNLLEGRLDRINEVLQNIGARAGIMGEALFGADGYNLDGMSFVKLEEQLQTLYGLQEAFSQGKIDGATFAERGQEIIDNINSSMTDIAEKGRQIEELFGNMWEQYNDALEENTDLIEKNIKGLETLQKISDLIGAHKAFQQTRENLTTQYEQTLALANIHKASYDTMLMEKETFDALIASLEHGWDDLDLQQQSDYKTLLTNLQEMNNNYYEDLTSAAELAKDRWEADVEEMATTLDHALAMGETTLDYLQGAYDRSTEVQERYLNTAHELYNINKLNRQIEQAMADTVDKSLKDQYENLQNVINQKAKSGQLTQYDVDMMQKQYELLEKQAALRDAQNAKDTVRLTRDENGNYMYQYTADQDKVDEATQEYNDVLIKINELSLNRVQELEEQMLEKRKWYVEQAKAIALDELLTEEEKHAKLAELQDMAAQDDEYFVKQMQEAYANLTTNNEACMKAYSDAYYSAFKDPSEGINPTIRAAIELQDSMATSLSEQIDWLLPKLKEFSDALDSSLYRTGLAEMTDFNDLVGTTTALAVSEVGALNEELIDEAAKIDAVTDAWYRQKEQIENLFKIIEGANMDNLQLLWQVGGSEGSIATPTSTGFTLYQLVPVQNNTVGYTDGTVAGSTAAASYGKKSVSDRIRSAITTAGYKFASGGLADYTGPAWVDGSPQKPELMLNTTDTSNLLNTIDTLHGIDVTAVQNLLGFIGGLASAMSGAGVSASGASILSGMGQLEQTVHISAEFPNATDRDEIIAAFDELNNRASQFINNYR